MKMTTGLLLVCFSLLVASSIAQPQYQIDALMDFYNSTTGSSWFKSNNWGVGSPCQDAWFGVTCDSSNNIVGISSSDNHLVGTIPESFGQLSNLQKIEFKSNRLMESLPQSFSNLTSLTYLSIYGNKLNGSFPDILFSLVGLNHLDLASNRLSGEIPDKFDSFTFLSFLNLALNNFTGSVPLTTLSLSNCYIDLSGNELTSVPWDDWTNSNALSNSTLSLFGNNITGTLPYKIYWPNLFNLGGNQFTGTLPELNITNGVPMITYLSLFGNELTGNLPVSLTQATYLNYIDVDFNRAMSGVIPVEYASMPNLNSLSFSNTNLTCPQGNKEWESFDDRAHVSCPSPPKGNNSHLGLYIGLSVGGIVILLIIVSLAVFFIVRNNRKKDFVLID